MLLVVLVAVVVASAAVFVVVLAPGPAPSPVYAYVNATLELGPVAALETRSYFSLNAASPDLSNGQVQGLVAATGVTYFNTGYPAESVNQTADLQYSDSGVATPYNGETDSQFITLCELVHCHSALPLPGEIDDPGAAAVTVRYVEQTLGFHPTYWEIGNEPAAWTHWGIPWTDWQPTDDSTPTALQFAQEVQRYVLAVRSVDPTAQFIGIQSDAGSPARSDWFTTLMQVDGPNLSAVAYHSYPGGVGYPGEGLSQYFATLSQPGSFPLNYPLTLATVRAACPTCSTQLFVGEYNSARQGNLSGYASSYPEAPYIAAGLMAGLEENASQVTFYGLQPGTAAGLLDPNDQPLPVYYDYATFFDNLAIGWINNATVIGGLGGVYALISHNATELSEMVVNTDVTVGLNLSFGSGAALTGPVTESLFGPGMSVPSVTNEVFNATSPVKVPPEGILMINGRWPNFGPALRPGGAGAIGSPAPGRGGQAVPVLSPLAAGGGVGDGGGAWIARARSSTVS